MTAFRLLAPLLSLAIATARLESQAVNARVDSVFSAYAKPGSPGCAVAVSNGGETVFAKGYGLASIEHDAPITPTTPFYAASVSKQFTAFAVALLAKQGKLSLNDDIRKWIPEVPDYGQTITVNHLIHHTSGIRDYFGLLGFTGWPNDGPLTDAQFLDLMSRQRSLNFAPGARFLYSNSGYVLLSILVKRASGQSLRDFAAGAIFTPLGMTHSQFRDDHRMLVPGRAIAYSARQGGWQTDVPGFDVVGDGGLFTTVNDLAMWVRNYEDAKVGGAEVIATTLTRARLNSSDSVPYAFGLVFATALGLPTITHGGSYGGYRTDVLRFPAQRLAVITLCNAASANASALGQRVAAIYLGDRVVPTRAATAASAQDVAATAQLSRSQLDRYAGYYWNEDNQILMRVEVRDTALTIAGTPLVLLPIGNDRFRASNGQRLLAFAADASGYSRVEVTDAVGDKTVSLHMPAPRTDAAALTAYVAEYYSGELDASWKIGVKDGALVARRRGLPDETLRPAFLDAFISPAGVLRFVRGADGRVSGFVVGTGRVTGFRFDVR